MHFTYFHQLKSLATAFGASGEGFVRISYAYSVEKLKAGLERIENFIKNL